MSQLSARDVAPDLYWFISPCGIGDYLTVFMAVGEYLKRWPSAIAHVAYMPSPNVDCVLGWDRVEYLETETCPPGYWHILRESARWQDIEWWRCGFHPRKIWFDRLGLDWYNKRMHYRVTRDEIDYAERAWGMARPRVAIGWHGSSWAKEYPRMGDVADWFIAHGANVLGIDQRGLSRGHGRSLPSGTTVREALSIPATADMYVGTCSGPSYAAIGAGTPTVILMMYDAPEEIFAPLSWPPVWAHWKFDDIAGIPVDDVVASCAEMWRTVTGER